MLYDSDLYGLELKHEVLDALGNVIGIVTWNNRSTTLISNNWIIMFPNPNQCFSKMGERFEYSYTSKSQNYNGKEYRWAVYFSRFSDPNPTVYYKAGGITDINDQEAWTFWEEGGTMVHGFSPYQSYGGAYYQDMTPIARPRIRFHYWSENPKKPGLGHIEVFPNKQNGKTNIACYNNDLEYSYDNKTYTLIEKHWYKTYVDPVPIYVRIKKQNYFYASRPLILDLSKNPPVQIDPDLPLEPQPPILPPEPEEPVYSKSLYNKIIVLIKSYFR